MNKLVCFSACGPEAVANFNKTVKEKVDTKEIMNELNVSVEFPEGEKISIWALRDSKRNEILWKKLNTGDFVLFYSDRKFVSYGRVLNTYVNSDISNRLWGENKFKYLIFMTPNKTISFPRDKLWSIFEYSERATIQGMVIPRFEIQKQLIGQYGSVGSFLTEVLGIDVAI